MKVLVTGSNGFVGKNLRSELSLYEDVEVLCFDKDSTEEELDKYTKECDFVFHLAGVNRPQDPKEFMEGNFGFTSTLLDKLKEHKNKAPIMISSSIQAELDNDYGKSKKAGEDLIFQYGKENNVKVYVYRFPNVFGKWCRPNYNSVIATWCYNISHNIEIQVNDPSKELTLVYIDDVCEEIVKCLEDRPTKDEEYCKVPITYTKTLGEISSLIRSFKENDRGIMVPATGDEFTKDLYATYISYVPLEEMVVNLEEHRDNRGVFCELVRTKDAGQVSVSTTNPNIVRGGHYHHTKMERFIVIKGKAKIEFEHVLTHEKYEFEVSGEKLQYVTIPVGYQHSINNIGDDEMILILWANELFDPNIPDTFVMEG
ncbi:MAG: capsular polysaccharide biosynthesis protein CapF [Bacilli bacterium]|nr:capsular polysaccharide biosynthesis protein CapF [Bacilli bacterium]